MIDTAPGATLQDERDCARLVLDSIHCNDQQDYVGFAALFCEDGELYRPSDAVTPLRGRTAIITEYGRRPPHRMTRHLCTNLRVDLLDADRARAQCCLLVYACDRQLAEVAPFGYAAEPRHLIGEFDDELVRTAAGWRIARRRARFVMHASI